VLDAGDLARSQDDGRLGVIIGFQSTEMFAGGLDSIDAFYREGTRIMQMSYNGPGLFAHGCLSESDAGLTELGREALARMQALGVLVDLSHANRVTTAETIANATRPLVISHTGCNAVYRHPRNNDDTELRALAEHGGVAGIYLMPFLDGGTGELTADMWFAHLDHALQVCGVEHVGIGSDQGVRPVSDGPGYRRKLREEVAARQAAGISAPGESPDRPPFIPAFNRDDRLPAIAQAMAGRGYDPRVIDAVIGGNFARVMAGAWVSG
jgi:membrane dipeptidase